MTRTSNTETTETVVVSAVLIRDAAGRVLTVRKRGTERFMQPGGKPEPGEDARATAVREVAEELGLVLDPGSLAELGTWTAPAANEAGWDVRGTVFAAPLTGEPAVAAEIDAVRWVDLEDPDTDREELAPLLADRVRSELARPAAAGIGRACVFTGSAFGTDPAYADAARQVGLTLASYGVGLVYGGGDVGLMGTAADAAMHAGGEAIGVIPQALVDREVAHHGLTALEVVPDMHVRKARMNALSDAFVVLPGGIGTLEELFEVWTWRQLGLHAKPVILYDVDDFWAPLLALVDRQVEKGFLGAESRANLRVVRSPGELIDALGPR